LPGGFGRQGDRRAVEGSQDASMGIPVF